MDRAARRLLGIIGTMVFIFIFGAGAEFYDDVIKPIVNSYTPTPYPTIPPVVRSSPKPTSTPQTCLLWSQINTDMIGKTVCVYGEVFSYYTTATSSTHIKFSNLYYSFFIEDINGKYPNLHTGDCIQAYGAIQLYDTIPYMTVDRLYQCQ